MTVKQLIEELEGAENQDAEVRLAQQPTWPFEYSVGDVVEAKVCEYDEDDVSCAKETIDECEEDLVNVKAELEAAKADSKKPGLEYRADDIPALEEGVKNVEINLKAAHEEMSGMFSAMDDVKAVVYIGEGSQIGYLEEAARNELQWSRDR